MTWTKPGHASVIQWTTLSGLEFWKCTQQAEPDIVVAITRIVVVTVGRTQVLRIVVPTATTYDAVGACKNGHYAIFKDVSKISFLIEREFT